MKWLRKQLRAFLGISDDNHAIHRRVEGLSSRISYIEKKLKEKRLVK